MPTGGIDNAFIFGSCFLPSYDKHKEEFLTEGKEDEEFAKKEGNWKKTFDKVTGDLEVVGTDDNDKTLTITIRKSEGKIELKDWNDNDVVIDGNGIKITDTKGNKTTWDDSGIKTEDKNGNKVTMDSNGLKAEDKNGNKITKDSSGVKVEDKNGQSLEMAAAGMTLKSTTLIKIDCPAGISIVTADSAPWQPNIVPACPFGFSHGGPTAGITVLKGV
jgi:hypothetical protein